MKHNLVTRQEATDATAGCPMHGGAPAASCPTGAAARSFDAFDEPFQVNPAETLRWAREAVPVFYDEALGYWVISRYDDVKSIFRDPITFSPCNVLERITPLSPEAHAILDAHDYKPGRTLVNEDEPAHMLRRRALMKSFEPAELEPKRALVQKLVSDYVDRFVDAGSVDLVEAMLWEIPLTVALQFLGVPADDVDRLRSYSVALTKATWGRPSPEEQLAIADSVGKFWQLAGEVLDRMRANPEGDGWMVFAVRQNREHPDIVTDSYLHSMMLAIILAAHETTTLASTNMMSLLLQDRHAWDDLCANPALIPNAVEECLRYAGSVKAWRRQTTADVVIAGVPIPAGAKLLLVTASANQDERQFESADRFDIYRDNTAAHLTFGYGSHQCMGKNIARMEMCVFLEELTRRLPHMEFVPGQSADYTPSISFRGPDHLLVRWDPARNPERVDPTLLQRRSTFPIGAPAKGPVARLLTVVDVTREADDVIGLTLADPHGRPLSTWQPGAHIDIEFAGFARKYSLCGDPADLTTYRVAVLRESASRGGSAYLHETLKRGDQVRVRSPKNHFRLSDANRPAILIAGGIGITPIIAIADHLKAAGLDYHMHYVGRQAGGMAFLERIGRDHAASATIHETGRDGRPDLRSLCSAIPDADIYACGPTALLEDLQAIVSPDRLHVEYFANQAFKLDAEHEQSFEVELEDSGMVATVGAAETLLQALHARGIDVPSDCEEGLCGSCEVRVNRGAVDHRDMVLTAAERERNDRMMACCSRSRGGGKLVLAL